MSRSRSFLFNTEIPPKVTARITDLPQANRPPWPNLTPTNGSFLQFDCNACGYFCMYGMTMSPTIALFRVCAAVFVASMALLAAAWLLSQK
jgi:hypothetical protein